MKSKSMLSGVALATAAAGLFALGTPAFAQEGGESAKVHCYGVNACKGQSACKTASSECSGQNACKGKGYLEKTKAECEAMGGTTEPEEE